MLLVSYRSPDIYFYAVFYFITFQNAVSQFSFGGMGGGGGGGGCPNDFTSLGSLPIPGVSLSGCIYFSKDRSLLVSWATGQKTCKGMDARANLVFFTDTAQISQFQSMAPMLAMQMGGTGTVWFGAYQSQTDDTWYFLDGTKMIMNSTGGWEEKCPNTSAVVPQRCLSFTVGGKDHGWRDSPCSANFSFLCYIADPNQPLVNASNIKPTGNGSLTPVTPCPSRWTAAGGFCYQTATANNTIVNFANGIKKCSDLDPRATLPQFNYPSDWTAFVKFTETLHPAVDHLNVLLAAKKVSVSFVNPDKSWAYTNWYPGQPASGDCVFTTDLNGYMWNSTDCSTTGFLVCQLNTSPGTAAGQSSTNTTKIGTTSASAAAIPATTPSTNSTTKAGAKNVTSSQVSATPGKNASNAPTNSLLATTANSKIQPSQMVSPSNASTVPSATNSASSEPVVNAALGTQPVSGGTTITITAYGWTWSPPLWFLVALGSLVVIPVLCWVMAIVYRALGYRKYVQPPQPQPQPQALTQKILYGDHFAVERMPPVTFVDTARTPDSFYYEM